jgi:hypothetical protein
MTLGDSLIVSLIGFSVVFNGYNRPNNYNPFVLTYTKMPIEKFIRQPWVADKSKYL